MSTGRQSAIFDVNGKHEAEGNQRLAKRKCEELAPTILVE